MLSSICQVKRRGIAFIDKRNNVRTRIQQALQASLRPKTSVVRREVMNRPHILALEVTSDNHARFLAKSHVVERPLLFITCNHRNHIWSVFPPDRNRIFERCKMCEQLRSIIHQPRRKKHAQAVSIVLYNKRFTRRQIEQVRSFVIPDKLHRNFLFCRNLRKRAEHIGFAFGLNLQAAEFIRAVDK